MPRVQESHPRPSVPGSRDGPRVLARMRVRAVPCRVPELPPAVPGGAGMKRKTAPLQGRYFDGTRLPMMHPDDRRKLIQKAEAGYSAGVLSEMFGICEAAVKAFVRRGR
jgi:hypothetical protein